MTRDHDIPSLRGVEDARRMLDGLCADSREIHDLLARFVACPTAADLATADAAAREVEASADYAERMCARLSASLGRWLAERDDEESIRAAARIASVLATMRCSAEVLRVYARHARDTFNLILSIQSKGEA